MQFQWREPNFIKEEGNFTILLTGASTGHYICGSLCFIHKYIIHTLRSWNWKCHIKEEVVSFQLLIKLDGGQLPR